MDVEIGEIVTELSVVDGSPMLTPDDLRKIVEAVKAHLKHESDHDKQRDCDTGVRDRAYSPATSAGGH